LTEVYFHHSSKTPFSLPLYFLVTSDASFYLFIFKSVFDKIFDCHWNFDRGPRLWTTLWNKVKYGLSSNIFYLYFKLSLHIRFPHGNRMWKRAFDNQTPSPSYRSHHIPLRIRFKNYFFQNLIHFKVFYFEMKSINWKLFNFILLLSHMRSIDLMLFISKLSNWRFQRTNVVTYPLNNISFSRLNDDHLKISAKIFMTSLEMITNKKYGLNPDWIRIEHGFSPTTIRQ